MELKSTPEKIAIGVVGSGSWGTALANLLALKGFDVTLWAYESEVKEQILKLRENPFFLPGVKLSADLAVTNVLAEAAGAKDLVLVVVPSHVMRATAEKMATHVAGDAIVVSASKGIEIKTHLTMSAILKEMLPQVDPAKLAVLSGPTFAREVARNVPTVVTVACNDPGVAERVQHTFATPYFRVYTHDDLIGVELGGAVKNVIAIAAGIIDGLGLGLNTRAAMITRGLAEIRRLGVKLGANPHTFAGLAGMGDLVLTCTGDLSRNYSVGKKIGEGKHLDEILAEMRMVAEGVKTAKSVYNLSCELGVDMPISHEVYHILYDGLNPKEAVRRLMNRDLKNEIED